MLCETLDITPQQVLQDFADNLSLDYRYTSGSDEREMAIAYFMRCGYGMPFFEYHEVESMFYELETIRWNYISYRNGLDKKYIEYRKKEYEKLLKQWNKLKKEKQKKQRE